MIYVFNFIVILGDNLGHLKEEVQELQTTLKEEQFYSTELKKEVERLSTAVHKSTEEQTVETSEIDLYETQIKALSEAKDLRKFTKLEIVSSTNKLGILLTLLYYCFVTIYLRLRPRINILHTFQFHILLIVPP